METRAPLMTALRRWRLPEPIALRTAEHGFNNENGIVETPEGAYVLRSYRNTTAEAVRYEHALLAALEQIDLPFAIPTPVPTPDGDTVVALSASDGPPRLLSLARFFPGEPPSAGNLTQAAAGGAALGRLDRALADLRHLPTPLRSRRFGDLDQGHPAVTDARNAVRAIPASVLGDRDRLLVLLDRVQRAMPTFYDALPCQVIHRDYDAVHGNVLVDRERVSAVLDFEFAGPDLRVLDLAIALVYWPTPVDEDGRWATYEAFVRGYASATPLTGEELDALPLVSLGAVFAFLMWAIFECLAGTEQWDRIVPLLMRRALNHGAWLDKNERRLVERLHSWTAR